MMRWDGCLSKMLSILLQETVFLGGSRSLLTLLHWFQCKDRSVKVSNRPLLLIVADRRLVWARQGCFDLIIQVLV